MNVYLIRYFSLFTLLIAFESFGQQSLFTEQNKQIAEKFVNSEKLTKSAISDRYIELTRSEGILVNDVVKMGSLYSKKLHRSGKVIFNCQAGDYLNQLKSQLLKDYPNLDKLITIYVTEDPSLNAFATVNNSIYVNIGLLARIENEAQLAFILSHEIMHIVDAHIINGSLTLKREAKVYNQSNVGLNSDDLVFRRHEVSREFEIEADLDGYTLFLKQNYDPIEAINAMKLLEFADNYSKKIAANRSILFFDNEIEFKKLETEFNNSYDSTKVIRSKKEKTESLETHPSIEERIVKMKGIFDSLKTQNNGIKYIISEEMFRAINIESKKIIHTLYASEKDFISLFLYSSSELIDNKNGSDENLNYLGYSVQGLLFDHLNKYKIGKARSTNRGDSLLSYFYANSSNDEFAKWSYKIIDTLDFQYSSTTLKNYKKVISKLIVNSKINNYGFVFGPDTLGMVLKKDTSIAKGIDIEDINFEVTPYSDMSLKKVTKFNDFEKYGNISKGKVGIIGMNVLHIRKEHLVNRSYVLDYSKIEMIERSTDMVCENLEHDFDNQITSYVPNTVSYTGTKYDTYSKLNEWLSERLYFKNSEFVSLYNKDISEIKDKENIKYIMSNVNIGVKSFSFKSFLAAYFSPFVMPIYLPQIAAHIAGSSTRKYQLSLIYELESGNLVFWDKRTYLDANITSQLQVINTDLFKNFFND